MLSKHEIQADTNRGEITLSSQNQKHGRETRKRNEVGINKNEPNSFLFIF